MANFFDPYGTIHPDWPKAKKRFKIYIQGYDPDDVPEWQYKLVVVDRKYSDSDGYPIEAIAGGVSWKAAYAQAADYIAHAIETKDRCVF